jgi:hypothetical protein
MAESRQVASRIVLLAVALALGACTTLTGREHGTPIPPGASVSVEHLVAADRLPLERVRSERLLGGRHPEVLPEGQTEEILTTFSDDRCGGPCQMFGYTLYTAMPLLVVVALPAMVAAEVLSPDEAAAADSLWTDCARDETSTTGATLAPPATWLFDTLNASNQSIAPIAHYPNDLQAALRSALGTRDAGLDATPGTHRATLQAGLWRVELLREPAGDILLLCSRAVVNVDARPPRHFETCVAGRYCPPLIDTGPGEAHRLREAIGVLGRSLAESQARGLTGLAAPGS